MTTILGNFDLDIPFFIRYLFEPPGIVWRGLWVTIYVAVIAQTLGVIVGLVIALARMSRSPLLRNWADSISGCGEVHPFWFNCSSSTPAWRLPESIDIRIFP